MPGRSGAQTLPFAALAHLLMRMMRMMMMMTMKNMMMMMIAVPFAALPRRSLRFADDLQTFKVLSSSS